MRERKRHVPEKPRRFWLAGRVASFQYRSFSYRRAAPLLWLRSPKCYSRVRLRLPPVSLTQQRRLKRCRLRWRTHSVVGTRRSRFVAPPFHFRTHRRGSSHKRPCIERCPTAGGADRPEATCHNQPPWRPAAHQNVRRRIRSLPMTIVQLPRLSPQASKLWMAIPTDARRKILANVYCGHCRGAVSIVNVAGAVKRGDLVLTGNCAACGGDVARLVEVASA